MGGCRNLSELITFVMPRPLMTDFTVTTPIPFRGDIHWDRPMDEAVLPALGTFVLTVDGTPYECTPNSWSSSTQLNISTVGMPGAPAVSAFVRQTVLDPNCRSLAGTYARPQSNVQWFP